MYFKTWAPPPPPSSSSLRRRTSTSPEVESSSSKCAVEGLKSLEVIHKAREALGQLIGNHSDKLLATLSGSDAVANTLAVLATVIPPLRATYQSVSPVGSSMRAQQALTDLHTLPKTVDTTTGHLYITQFKHLWSHQAKATLITFYFENASIYVESGSKGMGFG